MRRQPHWLSCLALCSLPLALQPKRNSRGKFLGLLLHDQSYLVILWVKRLSKRSARVSRERGYVEGQNIALEILWSGGVSGQIPKRLTDSTRPNVDVIITSGTASTRAAQKATSTIPIIMASTGADPVAEGLVASFALTPEETSLG